MPAENPTASSGFVTVNHLEVSAYDSERLSRIRRHPSVGVRIEETLFEGVRRHNKHGDLALDLSAPGLGLIFKKSDAERYRV